MALLLTSTLSGFQSGIEVAETSINLESYSITYKPEFKRKLPNITGQTLGFVVPAIPSAEVTIKGEVSGSSGLMATVWTASSTLTNDTALFQRSAGTFWLDEATEDQNRDGWRSISMKFSADPLNTSTTAA